jgi:hypothetical protein
MQEVEGRCSEVEGREHQARGYGWVSRWIITEIAKEIGLDRIGEDAKEEILVEKDPIEMVPKQEASVVHEVILANAEPELPQPCLYYMLMRDYEESPLRMMDDLDDLDDLTKDSTDMDEWFPKDGSNDRDWVIKSKS